MKNISGEKVIYNFSYDMEPIAKISPGETITIETNDCFFQQIFSEDQVLNEIDYDRLNPATGPIYVEGAEEGDLLQVKILSIDVKSKGVAAVVPGEGVLGKKVKNPIIKVINIDKNYAYFNDIKIPIDPMIGVIGVAPGKDDGTWATDSPWKHGGNMDTTDIKAGSTLYLPIRKEGGLLALGDCHAIMGDGEICFTGLEVPANVTLEINVIKNKPIIWPMVETDTHTMIIASAETVDEAIYEATDRAVSFIEDSLNLTWEEAYMLTSLTVDIKISQLVDPKITVRAAIPNHILSLKKPK